MISPNNIDDPFLWQGLALQGLYTTELAALAARQWLGTGDSKAADDAAVKAMRYAFESFPFAGRVVIGEGERDEAPMLYAGETFGNLEHPLAFDIAVDPLEGTALTAHNRPDSITILAMTPKDNLLFAPDIYMQKFATARPNRPSSFSFDSHICDNIRNLAQDIGKPIEEMRVSCLDRERHQEDIDALRSLGVQVATFQDGDIKACMQIALNLGVDAYFGSGGAPEGVIAACVLQCLGGTFLGRLSPRNPHEQQRLLDTSITSSDKVYDKNDLAKPDKPMLVVATNVTQSSYPAPLDLKGIEINQHTDTVTFHSIIFQYYPPKHPLGSSTWYTVSRHCGYRDLALSLGIG